MPTPTDRELIELGRKALAAKEKDKVRTKAYTAAAKRLIAAHRQEYEQYLAEAKV